jgi:hypothetical protein
VSIRASVVISRRDHPAGFSFLDHLCESRIDAGAPRAAAARQISDGKFVDRQKSYRSTAPVAFATAATTLCPEVSISASVKVCSRGWNTTSIANDFLPSGNLLPS